MDRRVIYSIKSPYREAMDIAAYTFGAGRDACCIVGALRGNEIQQMAICAQLVDTLRQMEATGRIAKDARIMVIPCANYYSMNAGKRFWTMDNTDINRMFPGYEHGETTQRIADGLFKAISGFAYGIQMVSFYREGEFLPHVKVMAVDEEKRERYDSLADFGLPYGLIRKPRPYDTATLNYNWQVWGCHAYSMFAAHTDRIGRRSTQAAVNAVLRFLSAKKLLDVEIHRGSHTQIINEETIRHIATGSAGILRQHVYVGDEVSEGDILCEIVHPLEGYAIERIVAPVGGTVFFTQNKQLVMQRAEVFKIIPLYPGRA
jgi:predicted deacylase